MVRETIVDFCAHGEGHKAKDSHTKYRTILVYGALNQFILDNPGVVANVRVFPIPSIIWFNSKHNGFWVYTVPVGYIDFFVSFTKAVIRCYC